MAKKRGNGEGSIGFYNGRWVARVTMADGKRKAIYGKSRAEVARKLAIVLRDRDAGLPTTDGKTTVKMLLIRWLEESVKVRNRPSTQQFYQSITQTHLIPDLGDVKLVDLTPQHVERMLAAKLKAGLAPTTVSRIRATLRRALSMAEKHGLVHRNVASLADPPKITPRLVEPMSKAQARTFLDAIRGHRLEALFVLALTTGMRQGELLGLRWEEVDFESERLFVRFGLQRVDGQPTLVEPKTARSRRFIALSPLALRHLQVQKRTQVQLEDETDPSWNEMGLVLTSSHGTPLDGPNVTHEFQSVLREADLPHMRFHDLRHSCASFLLAQGASMRVIMEQLGHSQISLTMNTYSHVMPEAMQDAAALIEDALGNAEA